MRVPFEWERARHRPDPGRGNLARLVPRVEQVLESFFLSFSLLGGQFFLGPSSGVGIFHAGSEEVRDCQPHLPGPLSAVSLRALIMRGWRDILAMSPLSINTLQGPFVAWLRTSTAPKERD